jgi:hypothetical protein
MNVVYVVERTAGPILVDADEHRLTGDRLILYRQGRYVYWIATWVSFTRCELVPVETHVRTEKAS